MGAKQFCVLTTTESMAKICPPVAIFLKRKRKLVALLLLSLSYRCIVTINVLWLFLTLPWVGLQCVIVVFLDHTHLLLECSIFFYVPFSS